jgi:hypothetical protein
LLPYTNQIPGYGGPDFGREKYEMFSLSGWPNIARINNRHS